MRTGKFGVGVLGLLCLMPLTGCRSGGCHGCGGSCEAPAAAPPAAGGSGGGQVVAGAAYGGQKTCPVTGAPLAGVASPVPVVVRGETVYVCCAKCAAKVKADPDAYLARVIAERSGQSVTSPVASAPAAAGPYGGQTTCPVTGEPLDPSGGAIPVTVRGQTVYVCCRSCAAKVTRDPDTYLARVIAERAGQASTR